jgi:hypothetical protein
MCAYSSCMSFSVRANIFALLMLPTTLLAAQTPPRVFIFNPATLAQQKAHPSPAIVKLARAEADSAMKVGPQSVTTKSKVPPSGDKHDYMSMARYFWPNPNTPDHLPYVRHDGQTNPEINDITDHEALDHAANASRALALGWYLTGDERYAEHATSLLRTFFLAPATAMNPNLKFAQFIPGVNTGRGTGILDARGLAIAIDAIGLLAGSKSWTPEDQAGMNKWFTAYYAWLTTTDAGHQEKAAPNNHGSWFAAQEASIAMFLGKTDDARKIAEHVRDQRIPAQIDAAGMQKYELARTNSFSYSAFNLEALTELANIVAPTGVDLYATKPGILTALDALLPYDASHPWPHDQISKGKEDSICPALVRAAAHTHDAKYLEAQKRFDCKQTALTMLEAVDTARPER